LQAWGPEFKLHCHQKQEKTFYWKMLVSKGYVLYDSTYDDILERSKV
jgi:hypothetical protein